MIGIFAFFRVFLLYAVDNDEVADWDEDGIEAGSVGHTLYSDEVVDNRSSSISSKNTIVNQCLHSFLSQSDELLLPTVALLLHVVALQSLQRNVWIRLSDLLYLWLQLYVLL